MYENTKTEIQRISDLERAGLRDVVTLPSMAVTVANIALWPNPYTLGTFRVVSFAAVIDATLSGGAASVTMDVNGIQAVLAFPINGSAGDHLQVTPPLSMIVTPSAPANFIGLVVSGNTTVATVGLSMVIQFI